MFSSKALLNHNIYADINELRRLQYLAKGFSFLPQQPVNSLLSGKNSSKLRGRGLNFEELRHYRPGDDIRAMDWKTTRRTGKPHIKVYTEERERNIYLLVDQRSTMFFGSTNKMKSVIAAELAALIAWKVVDSGDRIGAIVYGDEKIQLVPAKRGRQHVVQVLTEIVRQNRNLKIGKTPIHPTESLNKVLTKANHLCRNNALVIFIGDGNGWNEQSSQLVKNISQHNEIIACHVFDPLEQALPKMSQMVISDGELQIQFSSQDKNIHSKYQSSVAQQISRYEHMARQYRIPLLPITTVLPVVQQLRKALGQVAK
ncbi:DUF58 domain-containing protein [Moritella sp. Urea-trap-13]|uniref:DUF58 domain-containing protein n=1 Tax=Moritella sp. Urea-trap-13 TaxID=2058327 RepID=UPI000C34201D|nr:DUF58 domain-containing protein [Moritella sp. Urea-trap-13]PKH06117.1 DUF58 domain-containing protein [Moritella sp. Urea-trap-13]